MSSTTVSEGSSLEEKSSSEPKFCFDQQLFSRPDFTVEKFINLNRRRATLDQLQNDLRAYLRHTQNSMIELINDDYADFVNLSSNLAGLKENIDKVSTDVTTAWENFDHQTVKVRQTAEMMDQKSKEILESRKAQVEIRNKLLFLKSLDRLSHCLVKRSSDLSLKWYLKLIQCLVAVDLWQSKVSSDHIRPNALLAKEVCVGRARKILADDLVTDLRGGCEYVVVILTALQFINETDFASKVLVQTVVKGSVEAKGKDALSKLDSVFEQSRKLRERWFKNLQIHNQFTSDVDLFLDEVILQHILNYLEDNLSVLCLPSDASTFFHSYKKTFDFASSFPRIQSHPNFLNGLRDRYNAIVYVKRLSSNFREELLAKVANSRIVWHESGEDRVHPLDPANVILKAINNIYGDGQFLPVVASDFWQITVSMIDKHNEWIDMCTNSEPVKVVDEMSGSVTVKDKWQDLSHLVAGSLLFDRQLFDLCVTKVFKRFEDEMGAEAGPFRQFLGDYTLALDEKRNGIRARISDELVEKASKVLIQVGEIPKQYRWTRKPVPETATAYVEEGFNTVFDFENLATKLDWTLEWISDSKTTILSKLIEFYLEHATKVLSSVQQTGSSLQRFKRKGMVESESSGNVTVTDEYKIRLQLQLDTEKVIHISGDMGELTKKLSDLVTSIKQSEA